LWDENGKIVGEKIKITLMAEMNLTSKDIIKHWQQGKSILDWRKLTDKQKREWLYACVEWTGLPSQKIMSFNYIIDGNQINSELDFYCLIGETFFGYRGYLGQDSHGLNDCFSEIFLQTKDKETVEIGAKIIINNSQHVSTTLGDQFQYIIDTFMNNGFEIELE
jgi:hypothetical protein